MNWDMDAVTFGLSFATISVGFASGAGSQVAKADARKKALLETVAFGAVASHLTKSYWPIIIPVAFLAYDYYWYQTSPYADDGAPGPVIFTTETEDF